MRAPKPFTPDTSGKLPDFGVMRWILNELNQSLRDVFNQFNRGLFFDQNFLSFTVQETIAAGATVEIVNKLGVIPNEWWAVDATAGGPLVRGATDWTANKLYVKNAGADDGTFRIRFFYAGRES